MAKSQTYIVDSGVIEKLQKFYQEDCPEMIGKFLSQIGEECVNIAREGGTYNDITGNLRSSIGCIVTDEKGNQISESDTRVYKTGSKGEQVIKQLLSAVPARPNCITLTVAAGMDYAQFVEDIHHRVVLSEAKLHAEQAMQNLPNELNL